MEIIGDHGTNSRSVSTQEFLGLTLIKVTLWMRDILAVVGISTLIFLWTQDFSLNTSFEGSVEGSSQNSARSVDKVSLHLKGSVSPTPTAVLIPLDETTSSQ